MEFLGFSGALLGGYCGVLDCCKMLTSAFCVDVASWVVWVIAMLLLE